MLTIHKKVIPNRTWVDSGQNYDTAIEPSRYFTNSIDHVKMNYNTDIRYTANKQYNQELSTTESQSVYTNPTAYIQTARNIDSATSYRIPRSGNQPLVVGTASTNMAVQYNNSLPETNINTDVQLMSNGIPIYQNRLLASQFSGLDIPNITEKTKMYNQVQAELLRNQLGNTLLNPVTSTTLNDPNKTGLGVK